MKTLMEYFADIAAIPHPSGHEKAIADYLEAFAKAQGLDYFRDSWENVVIRKPASPGYEGAGAVMLQGHTDMVPAAAEGKAFDFTKEPIELVWDGDIVRANGTTLGGDDGVAVVMMLHLLADKNAAHPALECVFTSQEETGLYGANGLDTSQLAAKYMINLDCGPEGYFLVSCAGGMRVRLHTSIARESLQGTAYKLHIGGLKSGHSGSDIHKERAGALMLSGLLLDALRAEGGRLISLECDFKDNVIPSNATVLFAMQSDPTAIVESFEKNAQAAYSVADAGLVISLSKDSAPEMLTQKDSDRLIDLLLLLPSGVASLSAAMPGLVETSSNISSSYMQGDAIDISISLRSSSDARKAWLFRKVQRIGEMMGMEVKAEGVYPGWIYEKDSPLRDLAVEIYERQSEKKAVVTGVHGGLECGIFKGKMPELDIIAIGPDSGGHHTADEWMSVSSLERVYGFVRELLESMKNI